MAPRFLLALPALIAIVTVATVTIGCPNNDDSKRVLGTEGRERWIVQFACNEPDLAEYRTLMIYKPDEAEAYAKKMRRKLETDDEELTKTLDSVNGRSEKRWWMSGAVTVEIEGGKAPSLEKVTGV